RGERSLGLVVPFAVSVLLSVAVPLTVRVVAVVGVVVRVGERSVRRAGAVALVVAGPPTVVDAVLSGSPVPAVVAAPTAVSEVVLPTFADPPSNRPVTVLATGGMATAANTTSTMAATTTSAPMTRRSADRSVSASSCVGCDRSEERR